MESIQQRLYGNWEPDLVLPPLASGQVITAEDIPDVNERLKASHYSGIPCTVSPEEYWEITLPAKIAGSQAAQPSPRVQGAIQ
jgi:hypothetical protein